MADRFRNAVKKRASRLFRGDHRRNLSRGSVSQDNGQDMNRSLENAEPHRRKLTRFSIFNHPPPGALENYTQQQARDGFSSSSSTDFLVHPAIRPLFAKLVPRTPRLEGPQPSLGPTVERRSARHGDTWPRLDSQHVDDQERRLSHQADPEDLHSRLSRLAMDQEDNGAEHQQLTDGSRSRNSIQEFDDMALDQQQYELINGQVLAGTTGETDSLLDDAVDIDHTVHPRDPVVHEDIRPHVHTIYEPRRTRSIHHHEYKTLIQPIIDPSPTVLPEQHWLRDTETGEVYRIPDALGRELI
ncbi:hypothetical protein ACJZ2D_005131 [Fusarium nematophilum]